MDKDRSLHRTPRFLLIARICATVLAAMLAVGCSGPVSYVRPPPAVEDNTLGPGDVFAVRVAGEADLSADYQIQPDGSIDYPYVGRIHLAGMPGQRIAEEIRNQLRDHQILREPNVSVIVREVHSLRIDVGGNVARPGTLPYTPGMTIVQVINGAGGFGPQADKDHVVLTRRVRQGEQRSYTIPVGAMFEGRTAPINVAPGDIVFVRANVF